MILRHAMDAITVSAIITPVAANKCLVETWVQLIHIIPVTQRRTKAKTTEQNEIILPK